MVHARYGSKDAVLDAIFMREYMAQLSPDLNPEASGLQHALAHLDRIGQLAAEDPELLRAMFVAAFEAVKSTSALRPRSLGQLDVGMQKVEAGLRKGISDGSVQPDVDVKRAVNDISSAVYGIAYLWLVLSDGYDLKTRAEVPSGTAHSGLRLRACSLTPRNNRSDTACTPPANRWPTWLPWCQNSWPPHRSCSASAGSRNAIRSCQAPTMSRRSGGGDGSTDW